MQKTPIRIVGLALLFFALSAPAVYAQVQLCENDQACDNGLFCDGVEACVWSANDAASICVPGSDPCAASETCVEDTEQCILDQGCESDDECDDGVFCNGYETCSDAQCLPGSDPCAASETCVEDTEQCLPDQGCESDDECDDNVFCNGYEICDAGECFSPGDPCADNPQEPFCAEDKQLCVECRTSSDCRTGEICSLNVCVDASECVLTIKPKKVRISKMFRPASRRFRIKGGEGFDPRAAIDFGPINVRSAVVNKKGVLKVLATIPAGSGISKGPVQVSVGDCIGEILLK